MKDEDASARGQVEASRPRDGGMSSLRSDVEILGRQLARVGDFMQQNAEILDIIRARLLTIERTSNEIRGYFVIFGLVIVGLLVVSA